MQLTRFFGSKFNRVRLERFRFLAIMLIRQQFIVWCANPPLECTKNMLVENTLTDLR